MVCTAKEVSLCKILLRLPCSTGWRFMACVFLAEAIQCTCDRKAATGSFNKGLKIKSTTVLLSGGWVPNDTQELPLWASSFLFGWEILATQLWAPCGREESRHRHNENISGKGGGKKPLINWVTTFVIHPRWIKHTKSWQTHQNGWTLNALDHAGPRAWWILVHAHLAHTTGQQVETSAPCC